VKKRRSVTEDEEDAREHPDLDGGEALSFRRVGGDVVEDVDQDQEQGDQESHAACDKITTFSKYVDTCKKFSTSIFPPKNVGENRIFSSEKVLKIVFRRNTYENSAEFDFLRKKSSPGLPRRTTHPERCPEE
jgi:hypothetical protein